MIAARRLQRNFADGFIAEAVEDLWEPWMRHADQALEDDALLLIIRQELAKRCKKSKTRGRKATPAEVVLRMLLLKHVRDWSYETLSREVRANLVYREFTRIGGEKVPDDRTMGNLARQLGPEVIEKLHRRVGDGVRVLTRIMKKVTADVRRQRLGDARAPEPVEERHQPVLVGARLRRALGPGAVLHRRSDQARTGGARLRGADHESRRCRSSRPDRRSSSYKRA